MATDREGDLAARLLDLGGELHPGRGTADHEHSAGRQIRRPTVAARNDLHDVAGKPGGKGGHARLSAGACGDDHGAGAPAAAVGRHPVAVAGRYDGADPGPAEHRRHQCRGIAGEEVDDGAAAHESVGVADAAGAPGKAGHPVRGEKGQRIPALAAPALRDAAALDHDMLDAVGAEAVAHREPGLPGPDDQDVRAVHGDLRRCGSRGAGRAGAPRARQPASIVIAIGVPFVSTS